MAVLGHVDHGKTSLLDFIRKSQLASREAGGITQRIGAYQVEVPIGEGIGKITFIDTPGHEAFAKMRLRGATVADIAVLVVASDDGVMPQTIESINHIKNAGIAYVVAINKIDLPQANPERVKQQLSQNGVMLEGFGGDIVAVPISAKTGQGVDELLEMILLLAELGEIQADPQGDLDAVVIESKKEKKGSVGTVIIKNGTLKVGDQIKIEDTVVKVRGLMDERGQGVKEAVPGTPVEVLGFESPPPVGGQVTSAQPGQKPEPKIKKQEQIQITKEENKFKIILKAESQGTLEAILGSLPQGVSVISSGVGEINESDVFLAKSTNAYLYGFRVKTPPSVLKLAEGENVRVQTFEIIYQFLEDLQKQIVQLDKGEQEEVLGKAEILAEFYIEGQRVAGGRMLEGKIESMNPLHLVRDDQTIADAKIISMRQKKEIIRQARAKDEFGILLESSVDFKVGDVLISYKPKANE